jgi:hypothetical protein
VDNSGAGAGAGDLAALGTAGASGPCKVSWASTTTVSVAACTAYSAGRKVVVPNAVVLTLTTTTANLYESVCLSGVNGAPALVGPAATITSSTIMPAFSQSAPVACLAILKNSSTVNGNFTGAAQGQIYDIRTFTSTTKEFQTASTAVAPGMLAQLSGTGVVPSAAAAGTGSQYGIVLMSDGSTSTTTPNAIVAVDGPAYVLATAGTAGQLVESGPTTAGYAATLANPLNSAITGNSQYTWVGQARTNFAAGCTSAATCLGSLYVVVNIH